MTLMLRGTSFGSAIVASGTLNFFGEGWRHHLLYSLIPGFSAKNATLITKTTTFAPRVGNMPLDDNFQPIELRPKCIYIDFVKGIVLNAVGLSGPGAEEILNKKKWQSMLDPFIISFMAVGVTVEDRLLELTNFVLLLKQEVFVTEYALEINISCPNTEHDPQTLVQEVKEMLIKANDILPMVPLIIKINALVSPQTILEILSKCPLDAIDVSNTIPWGQIPDVIDWKKLFGSRLSPLAEFGGGGLSGPPLLSLVAGWIWMARRIGIDISIIGGGGVMKEADALILKKAGASAISIGTMAIVRPQRLQGVIKYINSLYQ